jgi:hypothetical protein
MTVASSSTSTSVTSTTLPVVCELLTGKRLLLKAKAGSSKRRLKLLSVDPSLSLGMGTGSSDDPVLYGGTLRVVSSAGDGFDDTYELPAERWSYVKKREADKGYRLKAPAPVRSVLIRPAKRLKIVASGAALGHTLGADPEPVDVVLTLGAHCYCLRFGGTVRFKPDKRWLAKDAPQPAGCPPPAAD